MEGSSRPLCPLRSQHSVSEFAAPASATMEALIAREVLTDWNALHSRPRENRAAA